MSFAAAERFRAWVHADESPAAITRFRVAFALVWLVYDLLDVVTSGTAHIHDWVRVDAPTGLLALQAGLVVCELLTLLGEPAGLGAVPVLAAAALRGAEWALYLRLNDFAYFTVTALILAHARAGGLLHPVAEGARAPRWPRDVLLVQAGWMYLATGFLKLNDAWLSGKHLFVRLAYLRLALDWPFPPAFSRCIDALPCDAALARAGVLAELTLGALLLVRPRRVLVVPLVVAIHAFGALATNVWFFGPCLIAQVALLARRSDGARTR